MPPLPLPPLQEPVVPFSFLRCKPIGVMRVRALQAGSTPCTSVRSLVGLSSPSRRLMPAFARLPACLPARPLPPSLLAAACRRWWTRGSRMTRSLVSQRPPSFRCFPYTAPCPPAVWPQLPAAHDCLPPSVRGARWLHMLTCYLLHYFCCAAVHADDPEFKGFDDISQLPVHRLAEIRR